MRNESRGRVMEWMGEDGRDIEGENGVKKEGEVSGREI